MFRLPQRYVLVSLVSLGVIAEWGCMPSEKEKPGRELTDVKIVVDPGHGGVDAGAVAEGVPPEKSIVLDIAIRVEQLLKEKGLRVMLTRRTDEFLSLSKRASIANDDHADLFVSIHVNSCNSEKVSGVEIYYAQDETEGESVRAASSIQQSLEKTARTRDRGVRNGTYAVLTRTKCPSVLVEVGYLSNRAEAALLAKRSYRRRVARGIADGIIAYLKGR